MATTRPCAAPPPTRALVRRPAKQRLLELENEHRLEDAEALKFTDEQRISLFLSFRILPSRLAAPFGRPLPLPATPHRTRDPIHLPALPLSPNSYAYPAPAVPPYFCSSPPPAASEAFALLTNTHLVSFGKDDTVCVRPPSYSSPTSTHSTHAVAFPVSPHRYASAPTPMPMHTSTLSPPTPPGMPPIVWSVSSLAAPVRTSPTSGGKPRSSAREKGWTTQTTTPCPIRAPLPPLVSIDGVAPEEGDEDAWVDADDDDDKDDEGGDEDEMTVVDDRDHAEDGAKELPAPVPWCSELLAPRTPPVLSVDVHAGASPRTTRARGRGRTADAHPVFI
ncbi:hypothetical protein B0H14DRAFT_3447218 [Mycena olivaceomarginata]|nr:hypothetical protein B0H14DRAFT_3447218 [Mycena olivaceomarginata]